MWTFASGFIINVVLRLTEAKALQIGNAVHFRRRWMHRIHPLL
jgi:hypothetical protein